jgi:hypothetical protein
VLANPIDLIIMIAIAIGTVLWSVGVGGSTEELADILAANDLRSRAEAAGS